MSKNITPLPGIPLIHQPCFQELWAFDSYSEETNGLAVALNKDGFAIFDFPEPNFNEIVERIKSKLSPKFNWEKWRSGELADLRLQNEVSFCDGVREIAANKKILETLSSLYGRRAFPFQTLNFGVGTQQTPHSDHVHFHSIPEQFMCGVWVAFEDVDEQNGGLTYYPGSQNWILLTNEHFCVNTETSTRETIYDHYSKFTDTWQILADYYKVKPKVARLKKGQAVIWTANVVHGGGKIIDKTRTRWSQVTHYFFDDCVYTTPLVNSQANGKIFVRDVSDLSTGEIVTNKICGVSLTDKEIKSVTPKAFTVPPKSGLYHSLKAFLLAESGPPPYTRSRLEMKINLDELLNRSANSPYRNHKDIPKAFDASRYLTKNPDVLEGNVDPYEHYIKYGKSENRSI